MTLENEIKREIKIIQKYNRYVCYFANRHCQVTDVNCVNGRFNECDMYEHLTRELVNKIDRLLK